MIVEVVGIGAPNKGAELMLVSVMEQISARYPSAKFVLEPYTQYEQRAKYQCLQKAWFTFKGSQIGNIFKFVPKQIRKKFGIVLDEEVDIVLDASGFAYGDQWGARKAYERLGRYIVNWKKQGKKVILLPQAFGPFTSDKFKAEMRTIVEHSDLVCCRDDISFQHVDNINVGVVKQFPDFTNLCSSYLPTDLTQQTFDVCIIPNSKMIAMTSKEAGDKYIDSLVSGIELLQMKGREPFFLLHEGKSDREIVEQLNKRLEKPIHLFELDDPKQIKGVIGKSNLVISSRFHGLVSSLSQGVPCIGSGWSHKYKMLMCDYNCGELLVEEHESLTDKLLFILDEDNYRVTKNDIIQAVEKQKELTSIMWQTVFKTIDEKIA